MQDAERVFCLLLKIFSALTVHFEVLGIELVKIRRQDTVLNLLNVSLRSDGWTDHIIQAVVRTKCSCNYSVRTTLFN